MTDQNEADRAAIARASQQMVAAIEEDDIDGILSRVTTDVVQMAANEPILVGDPVRLRAWHQSRVSAFTTHMDFSLDELCVSGDWAFERWSTIFTLTPRGGSDPIEDVCKGIWIWQRQPDGAWKLARSIFNSDLPVPTG